MRVYTHVCVEVKRTISRLSPQLLFSFRRLYLFLFTATYAKLASLVASEKFSCFCPPHPALGELELQAHSMVSLDMST